MPQRPALGGRDDAHDEAGGTPPRCSQPFTGSSARSVTPGTPPTAAAEFRYVTDAVSPHVRPLSDGHLAPRPPVARLRGCVS